MGHKIRGTFDQELLLGLKDTLRTVRKEGEEVNVLHVLCSMNKNIKRERESEEVTS